MKNPLPVVYEEPQEENKSVSQNTSSNSEDPYGTPQKSGKAMVNEHYTQSLQRTPPHQRAAADRIRDFYDVPTDEKGNVIEENCLVTFFRKCCCCSSQKEIEDVNLVPSINF